MILFSASIASEKTAKSGGFSSVYFFCVGIPILKIVLSHAHRWVTSDGHYLEIVFSLVSSSPEGPSMVNE